MSFKIFYLSACAVGTYFLTSKSMYPLALDESVVITSGDGTKKVVQKGSHAKRDAQHLAGSPARSVFSFVSFLFHMKKKRKLDQTQLSELELIKKASFKPQIINVKNHIK